ncbi:MAG: ATP-binding protein [Desulfobacterales bacterium]|nr:ATP-binding protein [Desulfobacterales bacterium]
MLKTYSKIKKYILASMILAPFLPFIIVLGIGFYYFTSSIENSTLAGLKQTVSDHRQMIDTFLQERKSDLIFISKAYGPETLLKQASIQKAYNDLNSKSRAFVDLGVFDENGIHRSYSGPYQLTLKNYENEFWFKQVMKKGTYISDIFLGYRQVPHFVIAVTSRVNSHVWIIRATIDTKQFSDLVEKVQFGRTGEAYILNTSGIFQTTRRSGGNLMETDSEFTQFPYSDNGIMHFIENIKTGKKFLYTSTFLTEKDWLLVVRQETAEVFRQLHTASYLIILISLSGGAVIFSIAIVLTNRIINRIRQIDNKNELITQQLIHATRLSELGEMAAGFAHEINNPLQIIKNEQSLLLLMIEEINKSSSAIQPQTNKEINDSLEQIAIQISRAAKITQAILKFGRKEKPSMSQIELQSFIPEIINMVKGKATVNDISILKYFPENAAPIVCGDPSQLQQVLLNLLNNAIDAICEANDSTGGVIKIEIALPDTSTVEISVSDNGIGINPDNIEKIFAPFFTTKPMGQGTGLGLSVCYGIIKNMGGEMTVSSNKNDGTEFKIQLPAA